MRRRLSRLHAMAWAAVLLLGLGACSSPQEKIQGYLAKGEEYAKQGKSKEALLELRNALKLDPKNAETNYRIAQILTREAAFADALFFLRETQRLDPTRSDAPLDEAKLLLSEDPKRAGELVQGVIDRDPSNAMAYLRRMELALLAGNTSDALAAAMTAVELAPKDGLYHLQVGIVHQARIREQRLKGTTPSDELFQGAADAYKKSDELYGGNVKARINLGRLYLSWTGHNDEARAAFKSAIELANSKGTLRERQLAATAGMDFANVASDPDFADFTLEQLVKSDESNLEAWSRLANLRQTKNGTGEQVYRQLLEKRPEDLDVQWQFAAWLFANDHGEQAVTHLKELSEKSKSRARALELLSAMQLQTQKVDDAKETIAILEKEFPGDPSTQLATARLATFDNRFQDAAPLLRALVAKSETPETLRLLGVSEFHLGNYSAALAAADRNIALSREPSVEVLLLKARTHNATRDWGMTIQTYTQIANGGFQIPPRDLVLLASSLYEANRPAAGKQVLENLLASPEPPVLAAVEFGVREGDKSPAEARKHLEAALKRAPRHPGVITALTRVDLQMGNTKEAMARLDTLIDSGQAPPAALLARARLLAGQKQYEAAEKDMNRVFEAAPNMPGALELLVQIYAVQNKLDEATKSFEEADKAGALAPSARLLLGRLYLSRGDDAKARGMFERALTERPDLVGAKNDLAFLLAKEGVELDRALGLAQEAQQALSSDANVADTLGFVYFKKGLNEPALQQTRYAIQLSEEAGQPQAVFQYHLGLVLRAMKRNAEAADAFERALAIDQGFPDAATARKEMEAARAEAKATPSSS